MKKTYFFLCLLFVLGISVNSNAQTDPGATNLKHQWTFDNGSATDAVGGVVGTIVGDGTLTNNAFVATNAYMSFTGSEIGVNSYPGLTTEIWCTSSASQNNGWTMLSYFGDSNGGGLNYTFLSIARWDNVSMASLGTGTFWDGTTGTEYDDGKLHHFVSTVSDKVISLYIDGSLVSTDSLTAGNTISSIGTSIAYLGKGGWSGDPNWIGSYQKYSLYNKALSNDEVLFLFQKGAESQAVINPTVTSLVFDAHYPAQLIALTSANLGADISVTAPTGISVLPTTITKNTPDVPITVIYDGTTAVNGEITLTSGSTVVKIPVKTADDTNCYKPLYTDILNLFEENTGMNSLTTFGGWGTRTVSTILNDPTNVYCGASSIRIGDGIGSGSGSLDVAMASILQPSTTYRVKFMIKTYGGTFHIGVDAAPNVEKSIDTNGEWMPLEMTFTTGPVLGTNPVMYINNWACSGNIAYVDNYELYLAPDPIIAVSEKSIAYDPEYKSSKFTVTTSNISEPITILAPTGITVEPSTLPADSKGAEVMVTWDGTTAIDGKIMLSASAGAAEIVVKTTLVSNTACFTPLYTDKPNLIPDPYLNNPSLFAGWGAKSIVSIAEATDSVFCGSHSGLISGGSIDVVLVGITKNNTSYKMKAMIKATSTNVNFGIWGWGGSKDTISHPTEINKWVPIVLEFTTGTIGGSHGAFFNNAAGSYIDNWELYEMAPSALPRVNNSNAKIFVQNSRIVADFDLDQLSKVEFAVYSVQGALISNEMMVAVAGKTTRVLNVNTGSGVYVVKMTVDGKSSYSKIIK